MGTDYSVTFCDKSVGTVTVTAQGLYYCISASCNLDHDQMYELTMCRKNSAQNLGVLLPERGKFVLKKRIPAKCLGVDDLSFCVILRDENDVHDFVIVKEDTPFAHIKRLEKSVMVRKGETVGVCFK